MSVQRGITQTIRSRDQAFAENYAKGLMKKHGRGHAIPSETYAALRSQGVEPSQYGLKPVKDSAGPKKKNDSKGSAAAKGASSKGAY